jgi:hypothetical protein
VSPCGLLAEDGHRPRSERTQINPFGTFASQLNRRDTVGQANGPKNFSGSRNHHANLRRRTVRIPHLLETVALLSDVPTHGLVRGQVGTVVELLNGSCEVEFSDDQGQTHAEIALPSEQLLVLHYRPRLT